MTQVKYHSEPITKPQIKKIHTLKNLLHLRDVDYESLLFRFEVDSSKELNRFAASNLIELLSSMLEEKETKQSKKSKSLSQALESRDKKRKAQDIEKKKTINGFNRGSINFDRTGKATDKQILYISNLWIEYSKYPKYKDLLHFIKKVTKKLYMRLEYLSVREASNVIIVLEKWFKIKDNCHG